MSFITRFTRISNRHVLTALNHSLRAQKFNTGPIWPLFLTLKLFLVNKFLSVNQARPQLAEGCRLMLSDHWN